MTAVTASNGTTLFSATYSRDANGQLTSDSSQAAAQQTYRYTALNQLCYAGSANSTACTTPPTGAYPYAFDNADNLTTNNGTTQQFNAADQLCWTVAGSSANACGSVPSGATTYAYDTRGNRTASLPASGTGTCTGFDQANRLTQIQTGSGGGCSSPVTVATYTYDGDGMRQSKTVSGTTTHFTWSGSALVQEKAGTAITSYIYGPNGPVEQITGSVTTYLHHDQIGSTRLITDAAGATATASTFTFDPYGNTVSTTGSLTTHLMFNAEYLDAESGWYYLRARYYDPTTAQFLTRDPAVAKTMSPYAYVSGNPLNHTDPSGMIDPSQLSPDQINQINKQCSTWQNQSLCKQAAFCAENTFGLGGNYSGGDCHTIAQIAADDYNVVQNGLAHCSNGMVPLEGGYMATPAEAQRDLAETKTAFNVAVQSLNYYNADNSCKQTFAIGGVIWATGVGLGGIGLGIVAGGSLEGGSFLGFGASAGLAGGTVMQTSGCG